jgi:two-component sensor histidine kinase
LVHVSLHIGPHDDIASLFGEPGLSRALREAQSVLAQVFWSASSAAQLEEVQAAIRRDAPSAILVGVCADGQIVDGRPVTSGIVVSLSCFRNALLLPFLVDAGPGREAEAGRSLAASLSRCAELKGALLLAPLLDIDASAVLDALRETNPTLVLFGGGGGRGREGASDLLFNGKIVRRGVVAVAFSGSDLHIEIHRLFDWRPLGPALRLTEARSGYIRAIDGRPAFELYEKSLNIKNGEELYLLEYPLLIERGGSLIARNPLSAEADGGVRIVADAFTGETARLGYLDIGALSGAIRSTAAALRAFGPEGIYLYSCVCRHFTLQEETKMETLPFQAIAPSAGVFTYGEFCSLGGGAQLLNSSEVIVALREGESVPRPEGGYSALIPSDNPSVERHIRVTSHIFRFIGALTERLDAANRALLEKNAELAATNESLSAEIAERKRAEERERAATAEKAILLKELQHRVKNSMALISSLASLEAAKSGSAEAKAALERLRSRVVALGSLYEILYASGGIGDIQLSIYLESVVDSAAEGLGLETREIAIHRSIEAFRIDIRRAISIGLIVNELVTDSIKYAFPGGRKGTIGVRLFRDGPTLVLRIEDDGVGLPPGFDPAAAKGFGLTLVESLADQLGAEFSARSEGGAKFTLWIPA